MTSLPTQDLPHVKDRCMHILFEEQVERNPEAVALIYAQQRLTYHQLNCRANQLAHHLRRLGVGPETLVGIAFDRSPDLIIAILATLKAGGAFVPLDPAYPQERLAFMVEDAQVQVLLTHHALRTELPPYQGTTICVDRLSEIIQQEPETNPTSSVSTSNLAYVIYTSGSTGRPKGVMLEHRGLENLAYLHMRTFGVGPGDRVLQFSALSFDALIWELVMALLTGATLVMAPRDALLPGPGLIQLLAEQAITHVTLPPSVLAALPLAELPALRVLIVAGEACSAGLVARWSSGRRFFNAYGPTETTVCATIEACTDATLPPPIGRPIANTTTFLIDAQIQPVPAGEAGELWIGGIGLARGYWRRPELTAERFIPDPFSGTVGARLYRTGDLVRALPDGRIAYMGRIDHQVKIRGFRIELGEIEHTLSQHPLVQDCVVLAHEDRRGHKRLVAYIVPAQPEATLTSRICRSYLQERLPDFMVPALFVFLDAFPLLPNGKVDRSALPMPNVSSIPLQDYVAPRTAEEAVLARIWEEVLQVEQVGSHDNFFELGGDSLLSAQIATRATQAGLPLTSQQIFHYQTVAALAAAATPPPLEQHQQRPSSSPITPEEAHKQITRICAAYAAHDQLQAGIEAVYSLAPIQQGMLFHTLAEPDERLYLIQAIFPVHGPLDHAAFTQAWQQVVDRHPALRTLFLWEHVDAPVQVIVRTAPVEVAVEDWRYLDPATQQDRLHDYLQEDRRRGFDLRRAPLLRITLIHMADDTHQMIWSTHHLIIDGWSVQIVLREVAELYEAARRQEHAALEPVQGYASYLAWLHQQDETPAEQFWRRALRGVTAATPLVIDSLPIDQHEPERFAEAQMRIPEAVTDALRNFCRSHRLTLSTLLQGAWALLLSRYSGERDVVFGMVVSGREAPLARIDQIVGPLLNTLPIRVQVPADAEVVPWLQELQRQQIAARAYDRTALLSIHQWSQVQPPQPLFESVIDVENYPENLALPDRKGRSFTFRRPRVLERTNYPLNLAFAPGSTLTITCVFDTQRLERGAVQRLLGHLSTMLNGMICNPQQRLAELPLLTEEERTQILVRWNGDPAPLPRYTCLHHAFAAQAEQTPDALAVVYEGSGLTYRELNRRANRLAQTLRGLGVGPDVLVGICIERSLEMVIGVLAILKAGGAYVPLDPAYPQERLAFMIEDAQVQIVLTQESLRARLPAGIPYVIPIDSASQAFTAQDDENPETGVQGHHLAYVIYTSGSTGTPKGVLIQHLGVCHVIETSIRELQVQPASRVLQLASLNFDASVLEIFMALLSGAQLHLIRQDLLTDPHALGAFIRAHGITTMAIVPSLLEMLPRQDYPHLHAIIVGGEACSAATAAWWSTGRIFLNAYAPTETTIYATLYRVSGASAGRPPIGRPIPNTVVYVLDQDRNPVPVGVPGELYVGGLGIARGYLNRAELTQERFVANPFSPERSARLYRTGDIARWLPNGELEFLGRNDDQVKVRGVRIEPGEIEAVLKAHPGVAEAVVIAQQDPGGHTYLCTYVVPAGRPITGQELRAFLSGKLPPAMVPSRVVLIDHIPRTPSGKVDRRVLATMATEMAWEEERHAPRTAVEQQIAAIWEDLLRTGPLDIHTSFFDLGGHSLLAARLLLRLRETFDLEISARHFFAAPTIAGIAHLVEHGRQGSVAAISPAPLPADWAHETTLDPAIQPLADRPLIDAPQPPAVVLLTGATGFLGAFLLAELVQQTSATIFCLIRCSSPQQGMARLRATLQRYLLWDELETSRIIPVPGDLRLPHLGLTEEALRTLAGTVEAVYHCAADVSFAYPYPMLRQANVVGTQEIIRLAAEERIKPIHYISTLAVFQHDPQAWDGAMTEDALPLLTPASELGYIQSKRVAEHLMIAARARGIPASIYRIGRIAGHSRTGACNLKDFLSLVIKGCIQLQQAPASSWDEYLLPVDSTVRSILALAHQPGCLGQTFHLFNPVPTTFDMIVACIQAQGYPIQRIPFEEWRDQVMRSAAAGFGNALTPLQPLLNAIPSTDEWGRQLTLPRVDAEKTLKILQKQGIRYPIVDADIMQRYLTYGIQSGFLEPPAIQQTEQ